MTDHNAVSEVNYCERTGVNDMGFGRGSHYIVWPSSVCTKMTDRLITTRNLFLQHNGIGPLQNLVWNPNPLRELSDISYAFAVPYTFLYP